MQKRYLLKAIFLAIAASLLAVPLASGGTRTVPRLIFPVIGPVTYTNDFGDPRGASSHQGNDIMAIKKSPVVAVEDGTVTFWASSASAGCMLYLHGRSGTMYEYIHLNNDRTMNNDNKGKCVAGTAYAKGLRNGARVKAGQQIGYVGDSGDANGIASHLHFELHPRGGRAVSPFRYLKRARVLLFAARRGATISLTLKGKLIEADSSSQTLSMRLTRLSTSTGFQLKELSRQLTLELSPDTAVTNYFGFDLSLDDLGGLTPATAIRVTTTDVPVTLAAQLGSPLALEASSVSLADPT
jgi:hypothetical protein